MNRFTEDEVTTIAEYLEVPERVVQAVETLVLMKQEGSLPVDAPQLSEATR